MNAFPFVLRAKLRWFVRRSLLLYAVASVGIAMGVEVLAGDGLVLEAVLDRWLQVYVIVFVAALLTHVVMAKVQSARLVPRQVSFREDEIVVTRAGTTERLGWDWILAAGESRRLFVFRVRNPSVLELFLAKDALTDEEADCLRGWLRRDLELLALDG